MPWDPSKLTLKEVRATDPITNADLDVKLVVEGAGFGPEGTMFGTFVRTPHGSDHHLKRDGLIPCNDIKPTRKDRELSLRICPRKKDAGTYDLILWLAPPESVVHRNGREHKGVPVNDVAVLKKAITVVEKPIPENDEEPTGAA